MVIGSIRAVLEKGIELANSYLGISFPEKQISYKKCWASKCQPHCKKERCRFFNMEMQQRDV